MSIEAYLLVLTIIAFSLAIFALRIYFIRQQRAQTIPDFAPHDLALLAEIEQAISNTPLDLEELCEIAYVEITRLFEIDHFQLGLFEENRYRSIFSIENGKRVENQEVMLSPEKEGFFEWVRKTGQSLLIADWESEKESLLADPNAGIILPAASGIFAPLIVGDEVIGTLTIQSHEKHAFSSSHQHMLTILTCGMAASIGLILLYDESKFYKQQLFRAEAISRHLISSKPLSERLRAVLPLIKETYDYHAIGLYEFKEGQISFVAALPEESALPAMDQISFQQAVAAGSPQPRQGIPLAASGAKDDQSSESLSELIVPLVAEGNTLGALQLIHRGEVFFSPEQRSHVEMIGANLAIAMLEERNYMLQQEENWISTVLLEVARHAAQPGDMEEALQAVLQLTILLTGKQWAFLLIPDEANEILRAEVIAGFSRQIQYQLTSATFPCSAFPSCFNPDSQTPLQITLPPILADLVGSEDGIAISLTSDDHLLGLFIVEGKALQKRQISLIMGIAHQISLRLENRQLVEQVAMQRSLERELQTARAIQQTFLPKTIPTHPGWELSAIWRSARQVGGDFYDFIPLHEDPASPRWGIAIADVTDKGIPAALYMALCRTLLRSVAISRIDPGSTITRLNQLLFSDTQADLLVSLFYAVWEPQIARFSYANAGHNPPLLFRPQQPATILHEHGIVLGATHEATYSTHTLQLQPQELIVLYTDGVTEATDNQGQLFGLHRLESLVLGLETWTAERITQQISKRVDDFCGSSELQDDLTTVVIYRREE